MRPAYLRRIQIAAVAGCLLLASGTVPSLANATVDVEQTEGNQAPRVASEAGIGPWLRALLTDSSRVLVRAMERAASWNNCPAVTRGPRLVRTAAPDRAARPHAPLKVIVDDGAPF